MDSEDKILSVGWNHRYAVTGDNKHHRKKVVHAEVHAILQVADPAKLEGATVFILECSETKGAPTFETAHPCPNCNNVLTRCGVRQAVFTMEVSTSESRSDKLRKRILRLLASCVVSFVRNISATNFGAFSTPSI